MSEEQWFHNPDDFAKWATDMRRLIIATDDFLEAAKYADADGDELPGLITTLPGRPAFQ